MRLKVLQATLERPFEDSRLTIKLSPDPSAFPFVKFANSLVKQFDGIITEKIGVLGTDEVYWDIQVEGHLLTLHSQHYLGVFLCATDEESEELLRSLLPFAEQFISRL